MDTAEGAEKGDAWGAAGTAFDDMSFSVSDALAHAAQRLSPRAGQDVLDIGTGTGWSARNCARFGARVVAVDTSKRLLDVARQLSDHIRPPIDFKVGDAESLPCGDASFGAAISTFGVMFAPDHRAAADELARVLKPGGRMVLATWIPSTAVDEVFGMLARYESKYREVATDGPSPIAWGDPAYLSELLADHFDLTFERGTNNVYFDSADDMWDFYLRCFGPIRELHELVSTADQQAIRDEFVELHAQYGVEAGIAISRPYLIVRGARLASR